MQKVNQVNNTIKMVNASVADMSPAADSVRERMMVDVTDKSVLCAPEELRETDKIVHYAPDPFAHELILLSFQDHRSAVTESLSSLGFETESH